MAVHVNKAKPIVSAFVAGGKVKVVGARYDFATGKVSLVRGGPPAEFGGRRRRAQPDNCK